MVSSWYRTQAIKVYRGENDGKATATDSALMVAKDSKGSYNWGTVGKHKDFYGPVIIHQGIPRLAIIGRYPCDSTISNGWKMNEPWEKLKVICWILITMFVDEWGLPTIQKAVILVVTFNWGVPLMPPQIKASTSPFCTTRVAVRIMGKIIMM
ncbi:hypothetical protein [Levilactobacillus brevis]|uniref:hypothetical protein n=1 Tax=Levilactobacillus brevis TaxID=1580 RepID=UPI001CDB55BA|nr:hypothetical protein [Levilactobacillus brevis]